MRENYIFEGYYSGSGGTGTKYINADGTSARTWNVANNITLYAKWRSEYINITFDLYGTDNAFQHLGYTLNKSSESQYGVTYYNITKNNSIVSRIDIPATYTYNNKKYKITKVGGTTSIFRMDTINNVTTVTIPNTVNEIAPEAFDSFSYLESCVIPNSVTKIGYSAFAASNLSKIIIPSSVKSIGSRAFAGCDKLKEVYIESTDITFDKDCFEKLAKGSSYSSTIYVRNKKIYDILNSNKQSNTVYSTTTIEKTDYFTIHIEEIYSNYYYTQVSSKFDWKV